MRDDFTEDVKRTLAFRVSMTCSNPYCQADTSGPQEDPAKAVNVGVAAHITSASSGGPRFNPDLTPEQRSGIDNGIWLCQNCAKLIDNDVPQHPESVLRAWKTLAEHQAALNVGKTKLPRSESESQKKQRELAKWVGKYVMWVQMNTGRKAEILGARTMNGVHVAVVECTDFYVRIKGDAWDRSKSIPFANLELGYDDKLKCVEILEYDR